MIQKDLFAYQVETHTAYKIISDTFTEHEKCQLQEITAFELPIVTIPVRKNSPCKYNISKIKKKLNP